MKRDRRATRRNLWAIDSMACQRPMGWDRKRKGWQRSMGQYRCQESCWSMKRLVTACLFRGVQFKVRVHFFLSGRPNSDTLHQSLGPSQHDGVPGSLIILHKTMIPPSLSRQLLLSLPHSHVAPPLFGGHPPCSVGPGRLRQRVCAEGYGEEEKERLMDVQPEAGTHGRQRPNVRDAARRRLGFRRSRWVHSKMSWIHFW